MLLATSDRIFSEFLRPHELCDKPILDKLSTLIAAVASTAIVKVANGTKDDIYSHFDWSKDFSTLSAIARMQLPDDKKPRVNDDAQSSKRQNDKTVRALFRKLGDSCICH